MREGGWGNCLGHLGQGVIWRLVMLSVVRGMLGELVGRLRGLFVGVFGGCLGLFVTGCLVCIRSALLS